MAAYVCSVKLRDGETPRSVVNQAWDVVDEWEPGGKRGNSDNWWAGPSHFGKGYCAIYFDGDMSPQEIEAWQREFGEVLDLRQETATTSFGTY